MSPEGEKLKTSGEAVLIISTVGPKAAPLGLLQMLSQDIPAPEPPHLQVLSIQSSLHNAD